METTLALKYKKLLKEIAVLDRKSDAAINSHDSLNNKAQKVFQKKLEEVIYSIIGKDIRFKVSTLGHDFNEFYVCFYPTKSNHSSLDLNVQISSRSPFRLIPDLSSYKDGFRDSDTLFKIVSTIKTIKECKKTLLEDFKQVQKEVEELFEKKIEESFSFRQKLYNEFILAKESLQIFDHENIKLFGEMILTHGCSFENLIPARHFSLAKDGSILEFKFVRDMPKMVEVELKYYEYESYKQYSTKIHKDQLSSWGRQYAQNNPEKTRKYIDLINSKEKLKKLVSSL